MSPSSDGGLVILCATEVWRPFGGVFHLGKKEPSGELGEIMVLGLRVVDSNHGQTASKADALPAELTRNIAVVGGYMLFILASAERFFGQAPVTDPVLTTQLLTP